jgi:nitroreductase
MDALEALRTTRAMRRYTDADVSDAEVWSCLRAAIQAPSGGNAQPWHFLVVRDPGRRRALGEVYRRAYDRYERALEAAEPSFRSDSERHAFERTRRAARHLADHLGEAPVLVLVLMPRVDLTLHDRGGAIDIGTLGASVYPAVQNLMVAARALGIGTALTTVCRSAWEEVRPICEIPERFELAALVPMGRPRGRFGVAPRKPAAVVTSWERYGARRPDPDTER